MDGAGGILERKWGFERENDTPALKADAQGYSRSRLGRWAIYLVSIVAITKGLALVPGLKRIAPLVESDYCYLLIAADRFHEGLGLTSLQPVAPHQPWDWQYDWGFLTQWPAGYPILISFMRWLTGETSLEACRTVALLAFATAIVGWFAFLRRLTNTGVSGTLLALVAATTCLTPGMLVNPSTDLIVIGAMPIILLLVCEALEKERMSAAVAASNSVTLNLPWALALAGCSAGMLFWFRYAAIFVPAAIAMALLIEWWRGRMVRAGFIAFVAASVVPIAALVLINSSLGTAQSSSEQFNLGTTIAWDFSLSAITRAWWMLSDLGYYAHKPWAHWVFALSPPILLAGLFIPRLRRTVIASLPQTEWNLAACLMITLLAMLICAAGLFGVKFDYIGLERYYLPARPFYLLFLCVPLLLIPRRVLQGGFCLILLAFASWTLFQDWAPAISRWSQTREVRTPSGSWSRLFEPDSHRVYEWVRTLSAHEQVLLFSNFHEYVTLETKIPVLPIPPDRQTMETWVDRARKLRNTENVRVVFLLNPDNLWRSYWIPTASEIRERFELEPMEDIPAEVQPYAFVPHDAPGIHLTSISWN